MHACTVITLRAWDRQPNRRTDGRIAAWLSAPSGGSIIVQFGVACVSVDQRVTSVIHNRRRRRMAGDDDDNDDDDVNNNDDHVTAAMTVTSPMGLPPSVVALLGRMTSYRDRMAWTVVEDACRVCLTLSWDVDEERRRRHRQRSLEAPCDGGGGGSAGPGAAPGGGKESLWSRLRRSLQSRRSVSVDSTTADVRRRQQHAAAGSHWRSRDSSDAAAAREVCRSGSARRHRSASVGRAAGAAAAGDVDAAVAVAAWRRRRQRSWNDEVVELPPKDLVTSIDGDAQQSRGRLLPSLSLPERFLSPPPLRHQHHHHQQQQQLTPQDLQAPPPQYNCSVNTVRQTQPSVSSPTSYRFIA